MSSLERKEISEGLPFEVVEEEAALQPDTLRDWQTLVDYASNPQNYTLNPKIPNYVQFPWLNGHRGESVDYSLINPALQQIAAQSASEALKLKMAKPHFIVGIERSGFRYAEAIGKEIGAHVIRVLKTDEIETIGTLVRNTKAVSFTGTNMSNFQVPDFYEMFPSTRDNGVIRVVVADDFIAHGHAGMAICKALIEQEGISIVGYSSYSAKTFQGGVQKIAGTYGISVYSPISITDISTESIEISRKPLIFRPFTRS